MLKNILLSLFFIIATSCIGDDLHYVNDKKSSLSTLLSYKEIQLEQNLFLSLNLSSVFILMDDRFEIDEANYKLKMQSPDEVFLTLSYTF